MRQNALQVKTTRRFKVTRNSDHKRPVAPNLVQREFRAEAPDRLWTGDITYIWTNEGWMYFAVVLDGFVSSIVKTVSRSFFRNFIFGARYKPWPYFHASW